MTRIAVAGFQHETNTFSPIPTNLEMFESRGAWPELTRGDTIKSRFANLNIPISGFLGACSHETIPIVWAGAEPGGYVETEAFEAIANEIVTGITNSRADAVYLDLHGAMVTRNHFDGEAEILRRIRNATGPELPIAVSLDLHGNLSREFFELATVVTVYRTYPHLDMAETGARAATLLEMALNKPIAKAFRRGAYLIPITAQGTEFSPAREIYEKIRNFDNSGTVSVDLAMAFPPADVPELGPAVFAYANTQELADNAANAVLEYLHEAESVFDDRILPADAAVKSAISMQGPVVIADVQDNPGAGGTGETTGLIQALIDADAPDAIISMLHDPDVATIAHIAGEGQELSVRLGGRYKNYSKPLDVTCLVEKLSDGKFKFTGPMFGGSDADMGPVARLRIKDTGIRVVVGSNRAQNADQEMFRVVNLEPKDHQVICVKSAMHFMADYKQITNNILFAESPGANPCNLAKIPYQNLNPGIRLEPRSSH